MRPVGGGARNDRTKAVGFRRDARPPATTPGLEARTEAEDEANKKRWQESGGGQVSGRGRAGERRTRPSAHDGRSTFPPLLHPGTQGSADQWRWSLNWDEIEPRILVGACPRSPSDVDTLAAEAGATAIVCLQSDLCLEALEIDLDAIRLARFGFQGRAER